MNLRLVKCNIDSLDELAKISRTTFIDAFEKDNDPVDFKNYIDFAFDFKRIQTELLNADSEFYLVYSEAGLCAYFKLNSNDAQTDIKLPEAIELERIYVLEAFHGKKIGQWMLKRITEIASDYRKQFIWLGVWEKNTRAISFYERNGFTKFGRHPYYIGRDRQMDWMMRFNLIKLEPK